VVEGGLNDYVMFAVQGMEMHRQGDHVEAIAAYEQAEAGGMRHPSLKMALGGLLLLQEEAQDALKHLSEAIAHPRLKAGALHAMGLSQAHLGDHRRAARYFIQCIQELCMQLAPANEREDMSLVYENLLAAVESTPTDSLAVVDDRFADLLRGPDWKRRVLETSRHLIETMRTEGPAGMVAIIMAGPTNELADSVSEIDRYIRLGMYTVAMDEAHRAVELSPYYLPVHVRMAEIMMREGRIRQAINKYNMVARSYLTRDENDRAASILSEVLQMAPLDVEVRMNLIELLEAEDRMAEALDQRIDLANTYQQLGDFDQANQTYASAERIARQIEAPASKIVEIKHHIADISQMRLNTRQAQKTYEDILELSDSDDKALRALIDIYFTQGNTIEAVKRLDKLLGLYAKKGLVNRITQLLQELVQTNPNEAALRARLASIYRKLGQTREAIEQLDALGELQLDAGLSRDAANTIRQIIAMKPDRVEEYKRLLQQLNG